MASWLGRTDSSSVSLDSIRLLTTTHWFVKVAVVDRTGKVLETETIYPHVPRNDWSGALTTLAKLCKRHSVELVSIGNGTGSRETDRLVSDLMREQSGLQKIVVSEAASSGIISVLPASNAASTRFCPR